MFVKKKTSAFDWYHASILIILVQGMVIHFYESGSISLYVAGIAGVFGLMVSVFVSVWLIMYINYKKGYNFYTSPRFKRERKVAAVVGIILISVRLMFFLLYLIHGIALTPDHIIRFKEGAIFIPNLIFVIYYMLYMFAYLFGLRNPYYDDSLG